MQLTRDNLQLLPLLLDEIHDRYFDLEKVEYDKSRSQWKVVFGDSKRGPYERALVITGVEDYYLRDTERIRFYSINELQVNLQTCTLTLACNVPIIIQLRVRSDFAVVLI